MSTLQARLEALAAAIRDKFNLTTPRLLPVGGAAGQVLAKVDGTDYNASWISPVTGLPFEMIVAASDESTALAVAAAKITFRMSRAVTLTEVRGSLTVAQTSGTELAFDVKNGGASIFSTLPTFDNTENTTYTATTPPVISGAAVAKDAEITVDVSTVGDGTAKGLKIVLVGTYQ